MHKFLRVLSILELSREDASYANDPDWHHDAHRGCRHGTARSSAATRFGLGGGSLVTEQHLADLRAARKILAIDAASTAGGRGWIHPRFQFDGGGQPFPEIALVIEAFGDADPIAICDWFAEPNPLLDNHPPMKFW